MKRVTKGHTDIDQIMKQYDSIDREVFGICQKAEKQCKPAWAGNYDWSPKLVTAIKHLRYGRLRVREERETAQIKRLGDELSIPYTQMSKCVWQQMANIYRAQLTEVQQNDRQYRQDHLTEVAEKYAEQNQLTTQQAIIELLTHEDTRSTFRILRQRLEPINQSGLQTLWVSVDEHGNYRRELTDKKVYTKKEDIHNCLLRKNKERLGQASGTPFARGRFKHELKWDGTGKMANEILSQEIFYIGKVSIQKILTVDQLRLERRTGGIFDCDASGCFDRILPPLASVHM